jgi:glycosyltransferase involved in cell wall biosynthesis
MQLYALGLVKDEADILDATIRHALGFCDRIIYLDNGSTDGSWEIIQALAAETAGRVVAHERTTEPFQEGMRNRVYNAYSDELGPDGWWFNLDADEFLEVDPHAAIEAAVERGAEGIRTWQVQFAFTDVDQRAWEAGEDDPSRPIQDRRRYYRIDWRETRLWRNHPGRPWSDPTRPFPAEIRSFDRHSPFNRHYQFRDPEQIQRRLDNRRGDPSFAHAQAPDWRAVVQPAAGLTRHVEGAPWRIDWPAFARNQAQSRWRRLRAKLDR